MTMHCVKKCQQWPSLRPCIYCFNIWQMYYCFFTPSPLSQPRLSSVAFLVNECFLQEFKYSTDPIKASLEDCSCDHVFSLIKAFELFSITYRINVKPSTYYRHFFKVVLPAFTSLVILLTAELLAKSKIQKSFPLASFSKWVVYPFPLIFMPTMSTITWLLGDNSPQRPFISACLTREVLAAFFGTVLSKIFIQLRALEEKDNVSLWRKGHLLTAHYKRLGCPKHRISLL